MRTIEIPGPLGRRPRYFRAARIRQFAAAWVMVEEAFRRLFDLFAAAALIAMLSPLMLLRGLYARAKTGRVFDRATVVGSFRIPFERLSFAGSIPGRSLAVLLNVLSGDISFIGPRPLTPGEAAAVPLEGLVRFWIRPGIVSAYWLRKGIGVAYETEHQLDRDFYYGQSVGGDLGLMARAVPSAILGQHQAVEAVASLNFFGIDIANISMNAAIGWIAGRTGVKSASQVCFVNPDCLNIAFSNPDYLRVLKQAELVLPDGIGIHVAGRIKGTSMLENVNGTDLFPRLCERAAAEKIPLFLFGARPKVATAVGVAMQAKYPGLEIAGTHHGYFKPEETARVIGEINSSGAKILLVAMGAPRQDLWLAANREQLEPPVHIGVGGLFDFYSGNVPRAPMWMREIGLEWTWRLLQEPGRMWRRYLIGNPLFLYRVWKEVKDSK